MHPSSFIVMAEPNTLFADSVTLLATYLRAGGPCMFPIRRVVNRHALCLSKLTYTKNYKMEGFKIWLINFK